MTQKELQYFWLCFAGECAFPGCNTMLMFKNSDGTITNIGEICHIIAKTPDGPRGHPTLSLSEKDNPDNMILLCRNHHKEVDDNPSLYTIEHLRKMWINHINRVAERRDSDLKKEFWTGLILFDTDRAKIDASTIKQPVFPEFAIKDFFTFSSEGLPTTEDQWNLRKHDLEIWWNEIFQKEDIIHRFAIFAIEYIPIIIFLGFLIRDTTPTKLFQYQRIEKSWKWPEYSCNQTQLFTNLQQISIDSKETEIAISVSISGKIYPYEIYEALSSTIPIIEIYIEEPSRDWLRSERRLTEFTKLFLRVLDLVQKNRSLKIIHLFCACPTPISYIIGSLINPAMFPTIQTYKYNQNERPRYKRAIRFNEK